MVINQPPSPFTIEPTPSIREKVYAYLRDEILSGRIPGGSRVVEGRLAAHINVSRTPVREALHLLEMEGLLESIPRVGYRVRQIRADEVEEICEIRAVNEILAARKVIERNDPSCLDALAENLELTEAEIQAGRPQSFVDLDAVFHEILVRASGMPRLLELCQTLRRHMLLYRIESVYRADIALRAVEGHRKILECLRRRDVIGVESVIHDHLELAKQSILRYAFEEKRKKTE